MSKSLRKDFRREIKKSISRFISILLIVVLGVAFYSGIRSSMPAMQMSADKVYDDQNLMDIRVVSPLGLTKGDIEAIKEIEGVSEVEGSYSTDFLCLVNSNEIVTKVIAMSNSINNIKVTEGRYPEKYNECLVSREFLNESGLKIGDTMTLSNGNDVKVYDVLASKNYTIVGVCSSSYYLNGDMGTSSIGDGVVDGFAVIPEEAFVTDVYTSIYITVANAKELNCYGEEYTELINSMVSKIEDISEERCDIRYSEIRSKSTELLDKSRDEYYEAKAKVDEELAEAEQKLIDGEKSLEESKKLFEEKKGELENAEAMIPEIEAQIADGEKELAENKLKVEQLRADSDKRKIELEKAQQQFEQLKNDPNTPPEQLSAAESVLKVTAGLYEKIEQQIAVAEKGLADGQTKLDDAKATLEQLKSVGGNSAGIIADTEEKLAKAEEELLNGREEFETAQKDAEDELADAKEKLEEAENKINNMEIPVWYVLDRASINSYSSYKNDSESIGAIGTVFPIIFFLVAALVSLTTMTRMVEEQRTQIGTLKALGYSKISIAGKYICYALIASALGSVIGIFLGEYTIPAIIVKAYKMLYYNLEGSVVELNLYYGLTAAIVAVLCTTLAAFAACYRELRSEPAQLMRPEAPKVGKQILIERIDFIWERLNFSQKSALRNLFRYKKRFFMTLFGVGGCMALLLVGLGIRDSVSTMASKQYGELFNYDAIVSVDPTLSRSKRRAMLSEVSDISGVESYIQATRLMVYSSADDNENLEDEKNAYLVIPRNVDDFAEYVTLRERINFTNKLELTDKGVIITEKYADLLGVKEGDSIFIRQNESDAYPKEVKVTGITENYMFNYIYMTSDLYRSIYSSSPDLNVLMLKLDDAANTEELSSQFLKVNGVNSVSMNREELEKVNDITNRLYFVIFIMILAAGVLAFVVLYNLNNINISERRRELATLKLLGFYDKELATYVYRENIILTIFGTILGIFLGFGLHNFVMRTVETDVLMFGRELSGLSILIGAVLTILFSVLVNVIMYFKLKKIDMVESLKSVE